LSTAEELRLITLGLEVSRAATLDEACSLAVEYLQTHLAMTCAIRIQNGAQWRTIAHARQWAPTTDFDRAMRVPLGSAIELLIAAERAPKKTVRPSPSLEGALAGVLGNALQLVQLRHQRSDTDRRADVVGEFSRVLLGVSDSATLHRTIVEHMARAVDAEIGALAVFLPLENALTITATVGYPAVLVEHVRPTPGQGILGRVYATGEPIVALSVADLPGQVGRRRYRTESFVALPLTGPEGVVAVVALTDKNSGSAFTQADLALLYEMAVPAALAVARELLRDRTVDLAHLATVDGLTELFNRRYFETRLEQELQRQRRQLDELSLLMLDLDNFKQLNDSLGHPVGDTALKHVAEILRRAVRIFDVCARYGGEEFVIVMPGAGPDTALRIAERIRRQVEQHFAHRRSSVPVPLTVSIGVSTASPGITREALIAQADRGLLVAKSRGKNQVVQQLAD
jgi:diguanylate cyclase (GGDEF)-like protein